MSTYNNALLGGVNSQTIDTVSTAADNQPLVHDHVSEYRMTPIEVYLLESPNRRLRKVWRKFISDKREHSDLMTSLTFYEAVELSLDDQMPLTLYRDLRTMLKYSDWIVKCSFDNDLIELLNCLEYLRFFPSQPLFTDQDINNYLNYAPGASVSDFVHHRAVCNSGCRGCLFLPSSSDVSTWDFYSSMRLDFEELLQLNASLAPCFRRILSFPSYFSQYPTIVELAQELSVGVPYPEAETPYFSLQELIDLQHFNQKSSSTNLVAQGHTVRKHNAPALREQVHLHQTLCIPGSGHTHRFENCHFNVKAKHVKYCYSCFPRLPPNGPRELPLIAEGPLDFGLKPETLEHLNGMLDTLTERIDQTVRHATFTAANTVENSTTNITESLQAATETVAEQVTLSRETVKQLLEILREFKTTADKITEEGVKVNHNISFTSSAPTDVQDESSVLSRIAPMLPSLASIVVTLLADLPIPVKAILLLPSLQLIGGEIFRTINLTEFLNNCMTSFGLRAECPPSVFQFASNALFSILTKISGIASTPKEIDTFLRRLDLIPKAVRGANTILDWFLNLCKHILNFIFVKFGKEPLFVSQQIAMIQPFLDTADALIVTKPTEENYNAEHVNKLFNCYHNGLKLQQECVKIRTSPDVMRLLTERLAALRTLTGKLSHLAFLGGPRTEPLFLYLYGASGVGKTGAVTLLQIDIAKADPELDATRWVNNIYMRFPEQEYHDGATNDSFMEFYDDFGQLHDTVANPDPSLLEVIRLGNIIPYPRHMADVTDKGKIFARPRLVVMTSNQASPPIQSLTHPEAFHRRINMKFEIKNDPNVVCRTNADGTTTPIPLHEFIRNQPAGSPPLRTDVYRFCGTFNSVRYDLSYDEFLTLLVTEYRKNLTRTFDIKDFYDNYAKQPLPTGLVAQSPADDCVIPTNLPAVIRNTPDSEIFRITAAFQALHKMTGHSNYSQSDYENCIHTLFPYWKDIQPPLPKVKSGVSDMLNSFWGGPPRDPLKLSAASYKIFNLIESGQLPTCAPYNVFTPIYREARERVDGSIFRKLYSFVMANGPLVSITALQSIARTLNDASNCDELCDQILRYDPANPSVVLPSIDLTQPFDFASFFLAARDMFSTYSTSIEAQLLKAGFDRRDLIALGRLVRDVNSDDATYRKAIADWYEKLSPQRKYAFFDCCCAMAVPNTFTEESFKLTSLESLNLTIRTRGWGALNWLWSKSPILGTILAFSLFAVNASLVFNAVSSVFSSAFEYFTSKDVPVAESLYTPNTVKRSTIAESLYTPKAVRKSQIAESLYSPKVIRKSPVAESPVAEGAPDLNAHQLISSKIVKNIRILKIANSDGVVLKDSYLNGVIVRGRCMLTYGHHVDRFIQASAGNVILVCDIAGNVMGSILPSELHLHDVVSLDDKVEDLCMAILPRTIASGKDIVSHFIPASMLSKVNGSEACLVVPVSSSLAATVAYRIGAARVITRPSYFIPSSQKEVTVANLIEVRADTAPGDCGSVLVSLNPAVSQKICGLHVAGDQSGIACSIPVTYEKLTRILEAVSAQESQLYSHPDPSDDEVISPLVAQEIEPLPFKGNFANEITLRNPVSVGTSSALYLSPIHGVLAPTAVCPARLRPVKVSNEDGTQTIVNPMELSLQKAGGVLPPIPVEDLEECSRDITRIISNASKRKPFQLTIEEAVHGIEDDPYIGSLKVSTSPGFPLSYSKAPGKRGKTTWISHAEGLSEAYLSSELREDVQRILDQAALGVRTPVYWLDFPKDETRPIPKVRANKTRSVNCSPLPFTVACRVHFGAFCAAQMDGRGVNGSAIGINPYSSEWDRMAQHLLRVGDNQIAGDFGNWDGGNSTHLLWAAFDVIDQWYGDDGHSTARRTLFEDIASSTHVHNRHIYTWFHSMPSGTYLTACVNTLVNNIIMRLAWLRAARSFDSKLANMSAFNQNCATVALGDDHVVSVSSFAKSFFNQTHVQIFAESLNMTYTDEQKTDRRDLTTRPISEVTFLKRGFIFDSSERRYLAPLDYGSICEMFNWLRRGLPTEIALQLNAECAFRELCLYSKRVYDAAFLRVSEAFREQNFDLPPIPSWSFQRSRVLYGDFWLYDDLNI